MSDTLVIGGQPDFLSALINPSIGAPFHWDFTGRELVEDTDAEKVLDLSPSTYHRAPSPCSGEFGYYARNYGSAAAVFPRGIAAILHNLGDVGAKARVVTAMADVIGLVYPQTTVVASSNTTADGSTVAQDPFGTISTYASPTLQNTAWSIEVAFDNALTLSTLRENSQVIYVYLKAKGTYSNPATDTNEVVIRVKEGATIRTSKRLRLRAVNDETFVTSVLVNSASFSDGTLNGMSVLVECEAASGPIYFQIASIVWQRHIEGSTSQDSGWKDVETASRDLYLMSADVQLSSILPYLNYASNELETIATTHSYFMLYWDDSINFVSSGRPRIFYDPLASDVEKTGTTTDWRPQVGLIAEGPAYGTSHLKFGYKMGFVERSDVEISDGGSRWTYRREPPRTLEISFDEISAQDAANELFSVMRRAGSTRPFAVSVLTGDDDIREAASIYGYLDKYDQVSTRKDENGEWFSISAVFVEAL